MGHCPLASRREGRAKGSKSEDLPIALTLFIAFGDWSLDVKLFYQLFPFGFFISVCCGLKLTTT